MEKEIEITGYAYLNRRLKADEFEDIFIHFIESHHWYFGGGMEYFGDENRYFVQGCIFANHCPSKAEVVSHMAEFAKAHSFSLDFQFNEIIDGYYINDDGSQGKHVLEDMASET